MKRKITYLGVVFCVIFSLLVPVAAAAEMSSSRATYPDFNIVFSNISGTNATTNSPGTSNTKTVVGKGINPGYTMIKLSDLKYMGAVVQQLGTKYYITINGQTLVFTQGSASYSSSTPYTIKKPEGGNASYTFSVQGTTETEAKAQLIDGVPYVRLTDAAFQCGALNISYNASDSCTYVFDFRVNGNTAIPDSNTYIVGGSWLDSWSNKGTTQLAPHFKVNEIWDDGSRATGNYENQLKISVASLQSEENIRYHYNNNQSLNVTSGFRGWTQNMHDGGDKRSLHMRGRAIDAQASTRAQTESVYNKLVDEFSGSSSTPISSGISWLSRVDPATSISGAYDLEKMPHDGGMWIHLGVKPAYSEDN